MQPFSDRLLRDIEFIGDITSTSSMFLTNHDYWNRGTTDD